jgi:hypothetical protein
MDHTVSAWKAIWYSVICFKKNPGVIAESPSIFEDMLAIFADMYAAMH